MKGKILITGSSGFIGSFLVEEAMREGLQVYAGVRASSNLEFLQHPNIELLKLNLFSEDDLKKTFTDFDAKQGAFEYIIHNAGVTQARTKEEFYEVNFRYTKNLVNALNACGMPIKKLILISTLATYGPSATFKPIQLEDNEQPLSAYARSKMMADRWLSSHANFPFIILKPTAVFGPRDKDFLRLLKMINSGFEFSIGKRGQMISLIYVKDFARAAIMLLNTSVDKKTFLISDRLAYSKDELNEVIGAQLQKKTIKINLPLKPLRLAIKAYEKLLVSLGSLPFLHSEKLDEITAANWVCYSDPIWQVLNSTPQFTLHRSIEETILWYKKNGWLK